MKITIFTSNQPRHLALVRSMSECAERIYSIHECTTVFPGKISDFYEKSEIMQAYFSKVIQAEKNSFGDIGYLPDNVSQMMVKMGDLNLMNLDNFGDALKSDVFIVFGASYIKGALCDFLVSKKCLNLHMGISPYYRGTATNFWPIYERKPEYVGGTIHLLTKGLDSGPLLFHAIPKVASYTPFELGMHAVKVTQEGVKYHLKNNTLRYLKPEEQDKSKQIRYSKRLEFTDEIAQEYLQNSMDEKAIEKSLSDRNMDLFKEVYVG